MIKSLIDLLRNLQSKEDCRLFLENIRWHGVPIFPHCGSKSEEHYKLTNGDVFRGLYKCKDCRERFTVTVGTMFEGSHIPLQKWFVAIYVFLAHKKGISSTQLHKDIAVTQKTAWFMLSRIRYNIQNDVYINLEKLHKSMKRILAALYKYLKFLYLHIRHRVFRLVH